jgi:hypothetical protein
MLTIFKKIFSIRTDIKGNQIDFDDCWTVDKIINRNRLLARLIELVPIDSIWTIEGLSDKNIYDLISKHIFVDDNKVWNGTIWPKQNFFKIQLTETAKTDILKELPGWDLELNIIHQHIYKDNKYYLTSYDNLHEWCTWISMYFDIVEMNKLKDQNILDFYDAKQVMNKKTKHNK